MLGIMIIASFTFISFVIIAIIQSHKFDKMLANVNVNDEIKISRKKEVITVRCLSNFTDKNTMYVQTPEGVGYVLCYNDNEFKNFEILNPKYKLN